jgi:hypothetical protein
MRSCGNVSTKPYGLRIASVQTFRANSEERGTLAPPSEEGRDLMKSVVVTGGSGKAGSAVIEELLAHGYAVINVDTVAPAKPLCHFLRTDLNDLGQAIDAMRVATGTIVFRTAADRVYLRLFIYFSSIFRERRGERVPSPFSNRAS